MQGRDEAGDFKTPDSGASNRSQGAGQDEAGDRCKGMGRNKDDNLKTLDSGAGKRSTGTGHYEAGDFKTLAKRQLRVRLSFPGMDRTVERRVSTCLPCQASRESKARNPLKPTKAPEELWSRLYAEHWGPTQNGQHTLVVINRLTGPRTGGDFKLYQDDSQPYQDGIGDFHWAKNKATGSDIGNLYKAKTKATGGDYKDQYQDGIGDVRGTGDNLQQDVNKGGTRIYQEAGVRPTGRRGRDR